MRSIVPSVPKEIRADEVRNDAIDGNAPAEPSDPAQNFVQSSGVKTLRDVKHVYARNRIVDEFGRANPGILSSD